jgi:MFS transporter, DHA1 family, tetracycline resistance protein
MTSGPQGYTPPQPVVQGRAKQLALMQIFFVLLMDIIGLTILIPVAPDIVKRYTSDAFTITMLTGIYALMSFFAAPALGNISDRVGRRPVLLISVFGSAIGYFIFGLGGALWVLFLSRVIDGITGGNISTASAYIADVSTSEDRAKNFGLIGIAFGLGFVIGPLLGSLMSQISLDAPAFTAGVLSLISVAMMYFVLPESLPAERRAKEALTLTSFNPLASIASMLVKPGMPLLLLIYCVFAFGFNGVNSVFAKFMADTFGASTFERGMVFFVGGLFTLVSQGLLVQPLVKRFGEKTMSIVSLLGFGLGVTLAALAPVFLLVFPTALLRNGLGGIFWATMGSMTSNLVEPREQGRLQGVTSALQNLMAALGPPFAGAMYDGVTPATPLFVGALILALGAALTFIVKPAPKRVAAWGGAQH